MPQTVFEVVAENPQVEHVAEDVHDAAVHEHRADEREVDRHRDGLKLDAHHLAGRRVAAQGHGPRDVGAGHDLLRHGRPRVVELVVRPQPLQEDEDEDVQRDQNVVDVGRPRAVAVVVANRENHLLCFLTRATAPRPRRPPLDRARAASRFPIPARVPPTLRFRRAQNFRSVQPRGLASAVPRPARRAIRARAHALSARKNERFGRFPGPPACAPHRLVPVRRGARGRTLLFRRGARPVGSRQGAPPY